MIIESLEFNLQQGLNIFTGETGSGKSIVLEAIQGLISSRLNTDLIRVGSSKSYLEGTFQTNENVKKYLEEQGIENADNEEIITISREISDKGSRARVNGVVVTAKLVQELGEMLLEIHGQSSEQDIVQNKKQLALLDSFAGEKHLEKQQEYKSNYQQWKALVDKLNHEKKEIHNREKELDFLNFQFEELEAANLADPLEEENLKKRVDKLSKAEATQEAIAAIYDLFYDSEVSVSSSMGAAIRKLSDFAKTDEQLKELQENLANSFSEMTELVKELNNYADSLGEEEEDVDTLSERQNLLQKLRRKHGVASLEALIELKEKIAEQISYISNFAQNFEALEKDCLKKENALKEIAALLSAKRLTEAVQLSQKITEELSSLGMNGAKFVVKCSPCDSLNADGMDKVEFLFQANAGDIPRALNKVASGGELSRIMLLLKTILGADNYVLIFDEIDAGTSGKVSRLIGEKLSQLSLKQQVLCVTHQPLVAAFADVHFLVSKHQSEKETHLHLNELTDNKQKIDALVDLMAGERDKILAQQYAQELIVSAQERKNEIYTKQAKAIK